MFGMWMLGLIPLLFCIVAIAVADSPSAPGAWWPALGTLSGILLELWLYYRLVPLVVPRE